MSIIQSIILGIVQGAGEFLPISSTAHLILVPYFTGWKDPGLAFDVALHVGTLIALLLFFWKDWLDIILSFLSKLGIKSKNQPSAKYYIQNTNMLWLIVIATIPGAIFGFLLENKAETILRNPIIVAFALSLMGLVLYLADKYFKHRKDLKQLSWKDSLLIGISQAVAIIPGVSRSGATITAALARGINRSDAARFSFLLSTPIIFGAAMLKLPKLFSEGINLSIILGIIFSALSGYLAIKYLLKYIEKTGYGIFFWYRLGLAVAIVVFYYSR